MATIKKYNGSTWENTTARKYETKSEIIVPPTTIYSDGTAITAYAIKGNTVQDGTPTPSNPVDVNGVGVRTENLFDGSYKDGFIGGESGNQYVSSPTAKTAILKCDANTTYSITKITSTNRFRIATSVSYPQDYDILNVIFDDPTKMTATITTPANAAYLLVYVSSSSEQATPQMMINTGSTAKPYEPYGYKIPILNGQQTTNIYLGSTQTTRMIKKIVLDGTEDWESSPIPSEVNTQRYRMFLAETIATSQDLSTHFQWINDDSDVVHTRLQLGVNTICLYVDNSIDSVTALKNWLSTQYANGTPVTVWYVLATPQTVAVNEPLMKIGNYADTLSNAASIPTTDGANAITVDTTVQPSEFTATWTGWHNSSVKEWDGSDWQ